MATSPSGVLTPRGGIGGVSVFNNCAKPVYQHVSGNKNGKGWDGPTQVIPTEGFHMQHDTIVSVKLFHESAGQGDSISQFEFNLDEKTGRVWYDLSNVDGFRNGNPPPFLEGGMSLTPSGATNAACAPINCPAGVFKCKDAYNAPFDDKTYVCPMSTQLHLVLCPNGPGQGTQAGNGPQPSSTTEDAGPAPNAQPPSGCPPGQAGTPWFRGGRPPNGPSIKRAEQMLVGIDIPLVEDGPTQHITLNADPHEKQPKKRHDYVNVGNHSQSDSSSSSSSSSKTHVAKLPILGMVAGLACYFITML